MTRKTIAICESCGTPYAGFYDDDGVLRVQGGPACPSCGGTDLADVHDAEPDVETPTGRSAD